VPAPETKEGPREKPAVKLYSQLELLLTIADEVVSAAAVFNYDIKHAPVSGFTVEVPAGWEVVNVQGLGVPERWRVDNGKLTVPMNFEVQGSDALTVILEQKRAEATGKVAAPELRTPAAERESGFVAVETRDTLEVAVEKMEGLAPVDSSELPPGLRQRARYPILYSFRFSRHPYAGALAVVRHQDVEVLTAAIDTVNLVSVFTPEGKSATRVIYEVRNNKKQYLKIDLPGLNAGPEPKRSQVWSAYLDGEAVKPTINQEGRLLIPLKKSGAEGGKVSFTVELIYFTPLAKMEKKGQMSVVFPQADLPASEMLVTLYLPDKYKYTKFEGDLAEVEGGMEELAPRDKPSAQAPETSYFRSKSSERALNRQMQMEKELADELRSLEYAQTPSPAEEPDKPRPTGMLPVQFSVPLRGETHRFSKLLVIAESPQLSFHYKERGKPFPWRWAALVIVLIILALILALLIQALRWLGARVRKDKVPKPSSP
jgi:hypothetical protein